MIEKEDRLLLAQLLFFFVFVFVFFLFFVLVFFLRLVPRTCVPVFVARRRTSVTSGAAVLTTHSVAENELNVRVVPERNQSVTN